MTNDFLIGACVGWFIGSSLMWWHFWANHLIRSRREWYADRKARGLSVPADWDREEGDGL